MTVVRRGAASWMWAHPEAAAPGAHVECADDDRVVMLRDGTVRAILESGRHPLEPGSAVVFIRRRFTLRVPLRLETRMGLMRGSAEALVRAERPADVIADAGIDTGAVDAAGHSVAQAVARELEASLAPTASPAELAGNIATAERRLVHGPLPIRGLVFEQLDNLSIRSSSGSEVSAPRALALGAAVWAYWNDGWYAARVLDAGDDEICVGWEGGNTWAWLPEAHVKPRQH